MGHLVRHLLRHTLNICTVLGVGGALALTAVPQAPPIEETAQGGTEIEHVPVPEQSRGLAVLDARRTSSFRMVGITWTGGQEVASATVRTLDADGWSDWTSLEVDEAQDAADGTPASARGGTEPLWVDRAEGVEAEVRAADGSVPAGLRVELIDPGADPALAPMAAEGRPAFTERPAMIRRTQWGAKKHTCGSDLYSERIKGAIFHHTAGTNSYTRAESWSIVRGIQAYHVDGRGWCDMGYNYLVDKYGQIFEGRAGGPQWHSRGAHAGNWDVNTHAVGVSVLGNLDEARLTEATKTAVVRIIGWRFGTTYLPPRGQWAVEGGKHLLRISGHRQIAERGIQPSTPTACPGYYGTQWLTQAGGLRDRVATYVSRYDTALKRRYDSTGWRTLGTPVIGEYTTDGGRKVRTTKGLLLWRSGLNAAFVTGPILTAYDGQRAQGGPLGFPRGDSWILAGSGIHTQRFQQGVIQYDPSTGQTKVIRS